VGAVLCLQEMRLGLMPLNSAVVKVVICVLAYDRSTMP